MTLLAPPASGPPPEAPPDPPPEPAPHRAPEAGPRALVARVRQFVRYGMVSIVSTLVSLSVLGTLVATATMPAVWANVVATGVGTAPSFELNRRWVWGKRGRRSLAAEVGPFAVLSFAGLALSSAAVALAAHVAHADGLSGPWRTGLVEGANFAAFGSLWIAQFVILDRFLFARRGGFHSREALPTS
jgi:putative flippase GtrA